VIEELPDGDGRIDVEAGQVGDGRAIEADLALLHERRIRADRNVFEMLATANSVSAVRRRFAPTSAKPLVARHMVPSANRMAADTPGRP
jgi:hypothetical protein